METFCHINELRTQGFSSLRVLLLTSQRAVIWAPSASYMRALLQQDPIGPTPDELLWYVRNGYVQIMARKWWLNNDLTRQKHPWLHAKWEDDFDGAMLDIWHGDQLAGRSGQSAHVLAVGEPNGTEWAKRTLESGIVNEEILLRDATNDRASVSPATLEKMEGLQNRRDQSLVLLQDFWNHWEAFVLSGADRLFGAPSDRKLLEIVNRSMQVDQRKPVAVATKPPIADEVLSAVESVFDRIEGAGRQARSSEEVFERVRAILSKTKELQQLRKWVVTADNMAANADTRFLESQLSESLAELVSRGRVYKSLADYLIPSSRLDQVVALSSLIVGSVSLSIGSPLAPISLALLATPRFAGLLKWLGVLGEDYTGPRWPLYLTDGTRSAHRKTLEALLRELQFGLSRKIGT